MDQVINTNAHAEAEVEKLKSIGLDKTVWAVRITLMILWLLIGFGLWRVIIPLFIFWSVVTILFLAVRWYRQRIIGRYIADIRVSFPDGKRKQMAISFLEVSQSYLNFWIWLLSNFRASDGMPQRIYPPCELMDDGPDWIRKSIQRTFWITEQYLFPFILNGFVPPIWEEIKRIYNEKGSVIVFEPGFGQAGLIKKIAQKCRRAKIPAVFVGMDISSNAVNGAKEKLFRAGFPVFTEDKIVKSALDALIEGTVSENSQIIYLCQGDLRHIDDYLGPGIRFDLTWMHHFIHHLADGDAEALLDKIKGYTGKWYILEEFREWFPIFLISVFIWFWPAHLETAVNSILANRTEAEWRRDFGSQVDIARKGFLAFISNTT